MNHLLPWITIGIQLLAGIVLFVHQRNMLKAQKEAIESQRTIIDGMKSFHDIFDLEKVEGYVDIIKKKTSLEVNELQNIKMELELKHEDAEAQAKFWEKMYDDYRLKTREAISILVVALYYYEGEHAESLIRNKMPRNQEAMLGLLEEMKKKFPGGLRRSKRRRRAHSEEN